MFKKILTSTLIITILIAFHTACKKPEPKVVYTYVNSNSSTCTVDSTFTYDTEMTNFCGKTITLSGVAANTEVYLAVHNMNPWVGVSSLEMSIYAENMTTLDATSHFFRSSTQSKPSSIDGTFLKQEPLNTRSVTPSKATFYDYGGGPGDYSIGTKTLTFKVKNYDSSITEPYRDVTATLRAIGNVTTPGQIPLSNNYCYSYIFVDDQIEALLTSDPAQKTLFDQVVTDLATKFNGSTGIYKSMTDYFGYEWGGGTSDGGIDSNKNIYILLTDIYDDFAVTTQNIAFYYNPADEHAADASNPNSNQMQLLVLDTIPSIVYLDESSNLQVYSSTETVRNVLHLFQHMINYNQKYARNGALSGTNEEEWLDEGLSFAAEELFRTIYNDTTNTLINERFNTYARVNLWPLTTFPTQAPQEIQYTYDHTFAFMAYLNRNISPLFAKQVVSGLGMNYTGLNAIAAAATAYGVTDTASTLIKRWREALIYNTPGTLWKGYPAKTSTIYSLPQLDINAIIMANSSNTQAYPDFYSFPDTVQGDTTYGIPNGYATMIFAGKTTSTTGIIHITHTNPNLVYKLIKK